MSDYKYLMKSFQPSPVAMLWLFLIVSLGSLGLAAFTVCNEITDEDGRNYNSAYGSYRKY